MGVPNASDVLDFALLPMKSVDYPSVSRIFTQGIETGNATYDTSAAVWEDWDAKHLMHSRWVVKSANEGSVLGWAALSPVSSRVVFSGVAELSIYVDTDYLGKGLGNVLMEAVVPHRKRMEFGCCNRGFFLRIRRALGCTKNLGFVWWEGEKELVKWPMVFGEILCFWSEEA